MTNELIKEKDKTSIIGNLVSYMFNSMFNSGESKETNPLEVIAENIQDNNKEVSQEVTTSVYDMVYNSASHLFGGNTKIFMGAIVGAMLGMKYAPFTTQVGNHNLHVGAMSGLALGGLTGYYSTAKQLEEFAEAEL